MPKTILDVVDCLPNMRELLLEDRELFEAWRQIHGLEVSDLTFTNLFVWRRDRPIWIGRHRGFLILLRLRGADPARLYVPLGRGDLAEATQAAFEYLGKTFPHAPFIMDRVPSQEAGALKSAGYVVEKDRDEFDYVYWVNDLIRLEGSRYEKKRNRIRHCLSRYDCRYEPLDAGNLAECLAMETEWCRLRHTDEADDLAQEGRAIHEAMDHFDRLDLFGGAVRNAGRIQAFAVGERLDENTAVVHFEKAHPEIDGLYQVVNRWFCQGALSRYAWVNREQDLGIPGLRRAKMSYAPHHFVEKHTVLAPTGYPLRGQGVL